jgi:hypothetical protein
MDWSKPLIRFLASLLLASVLSLGLLPAPVSAQLAAHPPHPTFTVLTQITLVSEYATETRLERFVIIP